MTHSFDDLFSAQSQAYAAYRPRHPRELYAWLASVAPACGTALDCGTGNGQAAVALAEFFEQVVAIDPSEAQIERAVEHERVRYAVAPAESTGLAAASVDLVTCAVSIHWFDHDRFYPEVRRVSRRGGVIAAWTYQQTEITPEIDAITKGYWGETLRGYWSPKIAHVTGGYRDLPFPFEEVEAPRFTIEASLALEEYLGYLASWSATRAFIEANGRNPLDDLERILAPEWGDGTRTVRWPLHLRVGRVSA